MKNYRKTTFLILLMVFGFIAQDATAQLSIDHITELEDFPKKRKKRGEEEKERGKKFENFVLSTGLSLGYSGGFFFGLSPSIGYQFGERLRVNAGIDYFNFNRGERFGDVTSSSFGPFGNVQYLIYNAIFGQVQYQNVTYTDKFNSGDRSVSEDSFLIGVGYAPNQFQPGFDYNISISYNVLFEDTFANPSIYGSPLVYQAVLTYRF